MTFEIKIFWVKLVYFTQNFMAQIRKLPEDEGGITCLLQIIPENSFSEPIFNTLKYPQTKLDFFASREAMIIMGVHCYVFFHVPGFCFPKGRAFKLPLAALLHAFHHDGLIGSFTKGQ